MHESIASFYDGYGEREWERLEKTAYGRLIYNCHMWFLEPHLNEGLRVLDAGCGSGRFSIPAAKKGCRMTLLDISKVQLNIAENKLHANGYDGRFIRASVTDMAMLDSGSFDIVICYGAVLNYLHGGTTRALTELTRVLKHGGTLVISVCGRAGVLRACAAELKIPMVEFWGDPRRWGIQSVVSTGDETEYPGAVHPQRHYFTSGELEHLMEQAGLSDIKTGAAPSVFTGQRKNTEEISSDEEAWKTLLYTENKMFTEPGLADSGEFILIKGVKC
jgi:ubiquinone/menaquinone biosynthesis C-methylase UbiE